MGIFNIEDARAKFEDVFWDNVYDIIIEEVEFSHKKCEFDKCPFLAVNGSSFCKEHQKEDDNIQKGPELHQERS